MSRRFGSPGPLTEKERLDTKKRRWQSRSDEEIIQELDQRQASYRRGWPILPPLPLMTILDGAKQAIGSNAYMHLQSINSILTAQRLNKTRPYFAFRIPKDKTPADTDLRYLTLVVEVDYTADILKMDTVLVRLRSMLKEFPETMAIDIEVLDYRALSRVPSYVIPPNDQKTLQMWKSVGNAIALQMQGHLWTSVDLVRRGINAQQDCPVTVVVNALDAHKEKWHQNILPSIIQVMSDKGVKFSVDLLQSRSLLATGSEHINDDCYNTSATMGASLGVVGISNSSSTLGGVLTLDNGMRCAITNWHCVRDDRIDTIVQGTKALRPGNSTLSSRPLGFETPSTQDSREHIRTLVERARAMRNQADVIKKRSYGNATHHVSTQHARELESKIIRLNKTERFIGNLYAGSGKRVTIGPKHITDHSKGKQKGKEVQASDEEPYTMLLDWALIHIVQPKTRDQENLLPQVPPPKLPGTRIKPYTACDTWSTFNVERGEVVRVAKYGRTSGWTFGEINSACALINPELDKDISDEYGFTMKAPGRAFSVVSRDFKREFVYKGDSGSVLVHDGSGTWLGLLFGNTEEGDGYFIPMDVLLRDIKDVTGAGVKSPFRVAPATISLAKFQL